MNSPLLPQETGIKERPRKVIVPPPKYVTWCSKCGRPLVKQQIALRVADKLAIDFEERGPIEVIFHFCGECREELLIWFAQGLRGADERMKAKQKMLELMDKEDGYVPPEQKGDD